MLLHSKIVKTNCFFRNFVISIRNKIANRGFKSKIFFTPGNHDLSQHEAEYRNNIGYFNKVLEMLNM